VEASGLLPIQDDPQGSSASSEFCPEHGVKPVIVPLAEPHIRFTMLFESFAIEVLEMTQTVNSKIISINRRAGGYRNIENFKKTIFFYCGGLDLYPR
jgi:hypothetical protein